MAGTVAIGIQDFSKIIENDSFYIDKTDFIKDWWEGRDDVTLITRPRRFGKTLTMSMLEYFFSIRHAGRKDLFENLNIWRDKAYRQLQGTYPVIFLSFAGVKAGNYDEAYYEICRLISREYRRYAFLLDSSSLLPSDKQQIAKILDGDANASDICSSINLLSEYLYGYYGKKVIILLDEYDAPMQEAYVAGYWKELAEFMRRLMNAAFKTNTWLERGLMTGITRVGKESIFSDLNNLAVITTTSKAYETAFGFTEQEVFQSLEEYGLQHQMQEIKHWYDGFRFGDCDSIYNPWSIINYIKFKEFKPYWVNTSSNRLVGKLIQRGSSGIKSNMEDLINGIPLKTVIDEQMVFNQLDDNENAVWSFLLAGGYLKVKAVNGREYVLDIVNKEVSQMFEGMISDWFAVCSSDYNGFVKALLANDIDSMNAYMDRVALSTISNFDSGNHPSETAQPERFYHGLLLGLMIDLRDRYTITSNRESGFGRCDVLLEPVGSADEGMILEFKVFDPKKEKNLQDTVKKAVCQILEKRYAEALETRGMPKERIRIYGFAFRGKEVLINGGYFSEMIKENIYAV